MEKILWAFRSSPWTGKRPCTG